MSLLRLNNRITVRVTVGVASVAVVVEEEETDNVGCETETADNQHKLGLRHLLRLDETLNGFKEN